jgi:ABC-type polar amino acid transport system ATPase subunit
MSCVCRHTYNLTMRLNYTSSMMQRINRALGDAAQMTQILDEPRLVEDAPDASELAVTDGAIDFEHLGFRYHDAAEDDRVFDDLTLHIPAGQRVGLVGRSGSGKTTLTKLLLRLDDVQDGRVLVDGQDISRCTQQSLRRQIAYVPQEALLFHRSIRENIAYGRPDATEEQIREAARQANALEFIDRLPQGMDTMVGERGVKLSGGQRQRIAIARAILTDAPILVLDEATSAPGLRVRGAGAAGPGAPDARTHVHRRGAQALDRGVARPHRGAVQRQDRGGRHARRAQPRRRRVRAPVGPPDRRLPGGRVGHKAAFVDIPVHCTCELARPARTGRAGVWILNLQSA